jgi:hemolysin activation/secretion protein
MRNSMCRGAVGRYRAWAICGVFWSVAQATHGQSSTGQVAIGDIEQREAQQRNEREEALNRLNVPRPDVRLPSAAHTIPPHQWPVETPCFPIREVVLQGDAQTAFAWLPETLNTGPGALNGQCLGHQGINQVQVHMQNALIDRGWITTRVVVPDQDLSTGRLTLQIIPGRLHAIRMANGTPVPAMVRHALPLQPGELLNLRAIEQALENFKRVPSQEADLQIEPANGTESQAGDSNLIVTLLSARPWRFSTFVDDSGSEPTGKLQGSATVSYDAPLRLNDLLYLSLNHSLGAVPGDATGTQGHTLHYSLPHRWWLFTATHSSSQYRQAIAPGALYAGQSSQTETRAERMIYRDARTKVSVASGFWFKSARNLINDTEIELQRRRTAGWLIGLEAQTATGTLQLSANAAFRRGTGAGASLAAPEELTGNGTSRFQVFSAQIQVSAPWAIANHTLHFRSQWRAQVHGTRLPSPERFSIGGRHTVRGFDGSYTLTGDSGATMRNELSMPLTGWQAQAYGALDAGMVSGPASHSMGAGRTLVGGALGLRGQLMGTMSYDLFAGHPLRQPSSMPAGGMTGGFSLNVSY